MSPLSMITKVSSGINKVIKKDKLPFLSLTVVFALLHILLVFTVFWMRMEFSPLTVHTGVDFLRTLIAIYGAIDPSNYVGLPTNSVIGVVVANKTVVITSFRLVWIVLLSLASALYSVTVMNVRKALDHQLKVVKMGAIGVGASFLGSVLSTYTYAFVACCSDPPMVLAMPLLGDILTSITGIALSIASFIGILLASIYMANKLDR